MSWFGTSNPELSDPFYGIRAGHAGRRNAQRRRSNQNLAGMYGVAQMQQRSRQPRQTRSLGIAIEDEPGNGNGNGQPQFTLPTDYSVGNYHIKSHFKSNLNKWFTRVTNKGALAHTRSYNLSTVGNLATDFEQLKQIVNNLATYEGMAALETTYPNYTILLTVDVANKSSWNDMPQKSFRVWVGRGSESVHVSAITQDYQIALAEYQTQVDLLSGDPGYYDIPEDSDDGGANGNGGDFTDDNGTSDNGTSDNGTSDNGTSDTNLTFNNQPTSTYQSQAITTPGVTTGGSFPYLPLAGVILGAAVVAYAVTR